MFKSKQQPHCRWCGNAIAKHTEHHLVTGGLGTLSNKAFDNPVTLEDCQKMTDKTVLSVNYRYETDEHYEHTDRRTVYKYSTWDGESYVDEYFCNGTHAKNLGYAAAMKGWSTVQYRDAEAEKIPPHLDPDHPINKLRMGEV